MPDIDLVDPNDKSWKAVVGQDSDIPSILSDDEIAALKALDPTAPYAEGETPVEPQKGSHRLSKQQQAQIAIWIVEDVPYREAQKLMLEMWGFLVAAPTWRYYKQFRRDLINDAQKFLLDQYTRTGYASHAVRVRKLVQHARRLEAYIEENDLFEVEEHIIGGGKGQRVTAKKFAASLSKEYRDTVAQLDKILTPLERKANGLGESEAPMMDASSQQQLLQAASWRPSGSGEE